MDKSTRYLTILVLFLIVLFSALYYMTEYRTFGGERFSSAMNRDFDKLETFFQEEPDESLLQTASSTSTIKVPIFIYHSVRPYVAGESILQDRFDITPELFEQQLIYLRDHKYTTITPAQLSRDIRMGTTTPTMKPVMLTFDDGWENQYRYAYPLLKKYHMVATFYVYTKPINNHKLIYLSWGQLTEMSDAGMTIGSHTISHPLFKNLSPADIQKEIAGGKATLEQNLKKPVLYFAQPFGYSNLAIEKIIKDAGYLSARGTHKGVLHSSADLYDLQGYFVTDNLGDFISVLNR